VQKYNVKTSRLFFKKRNRMLSKLPPAFFESRREFAHVDCLEMTFTGLRLQFLWLLLELIYNIFLIPKPSLALIIHQCFIFIGQ